MENSDEREIYCVKINPRLWYKYSEGIPSYTSKYDEVHFFDQDFQAEKIAKACGGYVVRCVTVVFYEPIKINHALSKEEYYVIRLNQDAWYLDIEVDEDVHVDSYTTDIFKSSHLYDFDEAKVLSRRVSGRLYRKTQYYYEDDFKK